MMDEALRAQIDSAVERFATWLDRYGETSHDFQSYYASKLGRRAKALYYSRPALGKLAVAPMVFSEALVPSARRLFWKRQRFPIADAHYAMGFARLAQARNEEKYYFRAVHFLGVLERTRCPGYQNYCWGYPFDWQTKVGVIKRGTPLITTIPYVYEAFSEVYAIDGDPKWRQIMESSAEHAFRQYRDTETRPGAASCGYTPAPDDPCGVINASAYRAFHLTRAGIELSKPQYLEVAKRNLNFVLDAQNADGSWYYATNAKRDFIDHFHTCFVLKALAKIEKLTEWPGCRSGIERGIKYYTRNLFDREGLPLPFSKRPRLTVYRRELYDYAECINLCLLLEGRFPELDSLLPGIVTDVLGRWQRSNGAFKSRELLVGWDRIPMHRWAQSQLFRSLCLLLSSRSEKFNDSSAGNLLLTLELKTIN
jgi:hypothetical protein